MSIIETKIRRLVIYIIILYMSLECYSECGYMTKSEIIKPISLNL